MSSFGFAEMHLIYLIISTLIFVVYMIYGAWQDFDRKINPYKYGGDKFGQNYTLSMNFFWIFAICLMPYINLISAFLLLVVLPVSHHFEEKQLKKMRDEIERKKTNDLIRNKGVK